MGEKLRILLYYQSVTTYREVFMYKAKFIYLSLLICICFVSLSYGGAIPQLINYQGTLTDTAGNPVPDGQYGVVFNIYDVSTGGTPLWTETWNNTTVPVSAIKGNFNAMLGTHTSIPLTFFNEHPVTYLGIKVGNDSEMLPRQRISSVAYAFTAGSGGVPQGAIIMWSGAINQIPEGWALCDGNDGTPDLRNRFIVGAGSGYAVAATGGEASHTLTIAEIPAHNHGVTDPGHIHAYKNGSDTTSSGYAANTNNGTPTQSTENATTGISINNAGGGVAHNNLPPYYALAFIMKL